MSDFWTLRVRKRFIAALAAVAVASTALVVSERQPSTGFPASTWRIFIQCTFSHAGHDDPIVFPKQAGAAHEHAFFGNKRTNQSPNPRRMKRLPLDTTCDTTRDTAAYWVPTAIETATGEVLFPVRMNVYLVNPGSVPGMTAFPSGFKAVSDDIEILEPGGSAEAGAGVRVWFRRQCWDGTLNMPGSASYRAHTVPLPGRSCPVGFPILLPKLHFNARFGIGSMQGYEPSSVSQSNGVGWHGDFWNVWQQPWLESLTTACLRPHSGPAGCGRVRDSNIESVLRDRGVEPPS